MNDSRDIIAHDIALNRELRREIFVGNYPDDLKRKVAALYIENRLTCNALFRFRDITGLQNEQAPNEYKETLSKLHGVVIHGPWESLRTIQFYWFGKRHGYYRVENESDSAAHGWYYLGVKHGPRIYQHNRGGVMQSEFHENGNLTKSVLINNYNEILKAEDYITHEYGTDSWLANSAWRIVCSYAKRENIY